MARKTKETKLESEQVLEKTEESLTAENSVQLNQAQAADDDSHYHSRCGGALRAARESQSLSIQDIASRLRLGAKQIEALEADNFTALPEPTIVRGFIRNYAKQLKINAEPLLDAYSVMVPNTELHGLVVKPSSNMKMTSDKKPKPGRYLWAGLAVFLALGLWLFYQNYIEKPSPAALNENVMGEVATSASSATSDTPLSTELLPEAALPAAERETILQPTTELTLPAPASATLPTGSAEANPSSATAAITNLPVADLPVADSPAALPVIAPAEQADAATTPVAPSGMAKLEFNASQETWVSVVDASGREIYNKIIFAGSRDSLEVLPPVNVTVGNAGATSLNMNGKPVELAPHMRGNVARIKLE